MAHLRRLYGRSVMGEVIQDTVNEASRKIVDEHQRQARPGAQGEIPGGTRRSSTPWPTAQADLDFSVEVEVLPEIPAVELSDISLIRETAPVDESVVDKTVETSRRAQAQASRRPSPSTRPSPATG